MKKVLEIKNLNKKYNSKEIIKNLSFNVYKNDIFGLLGPNGAGKSTIMKLILGLVNKDSGLIYINSYSIDNELKKALSEISGIIESPSLFYNLSAYENLKIMKNLSKKNSKYSIEDVIKIVGLVGRSNDKVSTFSLGMKQRLGIAMALIRDTEIIILDEPTNGLDPSGIIEIRKIISNIVNIYGKTVIISSHLLHEIELICNRAIIIKNGTKIREGTISEIIGSKNLTIKIISDECTKILKFVEEKNIGTKILLNDSELVIETKLKALELHKEIIQKGFNISYFERNSLNLEDKFMDIIGETND
ncbi:ABC transporter ATP-binding protein [Clostridium massiliamazoniense]|uniref:ABC transporter ATP-binding protein n=1 Tax=Clostridium massiliamazoniense TaxID=1347366 RepID=UPI0006D80C2B|nr:ABC transporter ATP-binding protein [Clostridium massiliamazoniense]